MARRARVVVEGGFYHVYNRISSGEGIFADPDEASAFIEIIRDVKKRDSWTVPAWAVLSDTIPSLLTRISWNTIFVL